MASTNKLSDYYSIGSRIEIKDEDSYYSKLELIATAVLFSDSGEQPGIQARIFSGFMNSCINGELEGCPADTSVRISAMSDDYAAKVFDDLGNGKTAYNITGLKGIKKLLDTTASREFKLFAGYDGKRWNFIANMNEKKAVLYIKNSINPAIISIYLAPFVPEELKRRFIANRIEKKHKAGTR